MHHDSSDTESVATDRQSEFSDARPRRAIVSVAAARPYPSHGKILAHQDLVHAVSPRVTVGMSAGPSHDDDEGRVGEEHPHVTALKDWLYNEGEDTDYLPILHRFLRLHVTAIDAASVFHVLLGAARLVITLAPFVDKPRNPLEALRDAARHETSVSLAHRLMLTELQHLGDQFARCAPFTNLTETTQTLVEELQRASNMSLLAELIPIVCSQLRLRAKGNEEAHATTVGELSTSSMHKTGDLDDRASPVRRTKRCEIIAMTSVIFPITPPYCDVFFHLVLGGALLLTFAACALSLAFRHYWSLIALVPAAALQGVCLAAHFLQSPLVFYLAEISSCVLLCVAFNVDTVVYEDCTNHIERFPLQLLALSLAAFFTCGMCDLNTLRLRGARFTSALLHRSSVRHDDTSSFSSAEDENVTHSDPAAAPLISTWAARVLFPLVEVVAVCVPTIVRFALAESFHAWGAVVGEVGVMIALGATIHRYFRFSERRRTKEEEKYFLIANVIRSVIPEPDEVAERDLHDLRSPSARSAAPTDSVLVSSAGRGVSQPWMSGAGNTLAPTFDQIVVRAPANGRAPPVATRIGTAPTSVLRTEDDGHILEDSLLLMADSTTHRHDSTAAPRQSASVTAAAISTSSSVNSKMQNSIVLAGKNISSHGEMLLNVTESKGKAVTVWRTPLDEVHFSTIIIGVDGKGDILLWNWYAEELTNFHTTDIIGKNILSILPSAEYHAEMFSKINLTMIDRSPSMIKCSIMSKRVGKPVIDVALQPYPAKTATGATVGVIFAGTPVRHETLSEISNQLLDIHSNMQDNPTKGQLYKALLLLQSELPRTTVEVNLQQLLGRIYSVQFQRKSLLMNVEPCFPNTILLDSDSLQLVIMEMLQHFLRIGRVTVTLSHDEVARCVIIKVAVHTLNSSVGTISGKLKLIEDVPKWRPSVPAAQAARRMNCVIKSDGVINAHCSLTLVGALPDKSKHIDDRGDVEVDDVRCNVAICDIEALSSILVRNVVWERKHMLFFIDEIDKLHVALDGVDILFVRVAPGLAEKLVRELKASRPLLEVVVLVSDDNGTEARALRSARGLEASIMYDPIITSEVHDTLTLAVQKISARRKREDKVSDIRKLFTQAKSCPWVRGKLLGRGANAMVYEATNTITSGKMAVRTLAIKPEAPEEMRAMMESLVEEIKVMSKLEHKNIINYLYLERDSTAVNVFMEYAPGGSLRSVLDKKGKASLDQVVVWLRDILEGLAYLHSEGIVHLDIKCANVLLAADGTCKLSDFGTARPFKHVDNVKATAAAAASSEVNASGTMHFMAPEVLSGSQFDWSADIWSLGCMTMEMLTGKLPFSTLGPLAVVGYISSLTARDTVQIPKEIVDPHAVAFLSACLCVDPSARPNAVTLQNHPFIVQHATRHLAPTSTTFNRSAGSSRRAMAANALLDEDDDSSGRRESCFSAWSAAGGDQYSERRRATDAVL